MTPTILAAVLMLSTGPTVARGGAEAGSRPTADPVRDTLTTSVREEPEKHSYSTLLQEIIVTGIAGESRRQDSPSAFTIIRPEVLKRTVSTNLTDALAHQPGVSQITTGGGISKPVIRGLGYNRIITIVDGIRQEGQQWGDEHGLEVDAAHVWSAEVLKGPASLMYGSDALAGVLILHPEPLAADGDTEASWESGYQTNNGLAETALRFGGRRQSLVWNASWSGKAAHAYNNRNDGYVPGSQFRESAWNALLGAIRPWGHAYLRASTYLLEPGIIEGGRSDRTGELTWADDASPRSYALALPFQHVRHTKIVWDNALTLPGEGQVKALAAYQSNRREEFEERADEPGLDLGLRTWTLDIRYQQPLDGGWRIAAGAAGMLQRSANSGEEFLIPDYRQSDMGAFLTATWQHGRLSLSGGLRADRRHFSSDALTEDGVPRFTALERDFPGVTGSLGLVLRASEILHVRANLARGFRAPTVNELASNGVHEGSLRYEIGGADLRPEYSLQGDLGLDLTTERIAFSTALFYNAIDGYIYTTRLPGILTDGYATYHYVQGDALLWGGEAVLDIHPVESIHLENSFSYVNATRKGVASAVKWLPLIPAPRWNAELRWEVGTGPSWLTLRDLALSTEHDFAQKHFYGIDGTETATPAYTLVDLSASCGIRVWRGSVWTLTVTCQNLFDTVWQNHLSRLKYADWNTVTGRQGVFGMGRNFSVKLSIPLL